MKIYIFLSILMIALLLPSCTDNPTTDNRLPAVYGIVLDENGNPVADADVCVIPDLPYKSQFINFNTNEKQIIQSPPLELLYFAGSPEFNHIKLLWSTASEMNTRNFELQKSTNPNEQVNDFVTIATIKAAGNSITKKDYLYRDSNIKLNTLYRYKLIMNDMDGTSTYSQTINLKSLDTTSSLGVNFPNPFTTSTNINYILGSNTECHIEILEKSTGDILYKSPAVKYAGHYMLEWLPVYYNKDGTIGSLRPGIHTYKMYYGNNVLSKNMILDFNFDTTNYEIPQSVTTTDKDGRFVIPYNWFPDPEEFYRSSENGQVLGKFFYGKSAKIVVRKSDKSNPNQTFYQVYYKSIDIDKSKIVDLNCKTKRISLK